ncbi:MAG: MFS transporter, partial [Myxococcales bacterium]
MRRGRASSASTSSAPAADRSRRTCARWPARSASSPTRSGRGARRPAARCLPTRITTTMRGTPGRPSAVAEPRTGSQTPREGSSQVRWRILLLIVAASFVSYLLRSNLSIAGPAMIADLGLSELELGTVLSAFALGYTIFQFPGGIFGAVVGPRRAVTWMAL